MQQAASSSSRMRSAASKDGGAAHQGHEASVHTPPGDNGKASAADDARAPSVHDRIKRTPVKEPLHDMRVHANDNDDGVAASTPGTTGR